MLANVPNFKHLLTVVFLIQLQTKWSLGSLALIWSGNHFIFSSFQAPKH